jgi:hypothetical protein
MSSFDCDGSYQWGRKKELPERTLGNHVQKGSSFVSRHGKNVLAGAVNVTAIVTAPS